jgi:hypothetical protein
MRDEFHERDARAVVVHKRRVASGFMHEFARVFLEMNTLNANGFRADLQLSFPTERNLILRNLIPLRQVWIEVVLPFEERMLFDRTAKRQPDGNDFLDRRPINDGQRPRVPHAHGTYVRIRSTRQRLIEAITEHLSSRIKLRVDF